MINQLTLPCYGVKENHIVTTIMSVVVIDMMLCLPLKATSSDLPHSKGTDEMKLRSTVVLTESTSVMRNILL